MKRRNLTSNYWDIQFHASLSNNNRRLYVEVMYSLVWMFSI